MSNRRRMHDEVRYGHVLDQMVDGFLDRATLNSPSKTAVFGKIIRCFTFVVTSGWDELWGCFTQAVYQRGLKILNASLPTVDLCAVIATVEKGKMTCMLHGYLHISLWKAHRKRYIRHIKMRVQTLFLEVGKKSVEVSVVEIHFMRVISAVVQVYIRDTLSRVPSAAQQQVPPANHPSTDLYPGPRVLYLLYEGTLGSCYSIYTVVVTV